MFTRSVPFAPNEELIRLRVKVTKLQSGRQATQEVEGMANNEVRVVRGWKLFLVLPRMMLFRLAIGEEPFLGRSVESRVRQFQEGDWIPLLRERVCCADVQ